MNTCKMKKIVLLFSALLFLSVNAYGQVSLKSGELTKVQGKQLFKTVLGESSDEVIIGNESDKGQAFSPDITFTKWQGECSLKIIPDKSWFSGSPSLSADSKQLDIAGDKIGFYYKPSTDDIFKFGLILNEIPDKSFLVTIDGVEYYQFKFQLQGWENFDFFYQPPLTQKEIEDGRSRPDDIIGSYAIYHKTKANNQYKTGKFAHAKNILWTDVKGDTYRQYLFIENGIYYVRLRKDFAEKATYPLRANDTWGWTSQGASNCFSWWNNTYCATKFASFPGGTVTSITVFFNNTDAYAHGGELGIYSDDAGNTLPEAKQVKGTFSQPPYTAGEVSADVVDTGVSAGTYWLAVAKPYQGFYYDDASGVSDLWNNGDSTLPDTWTNTATTSAIRISIYATYTAGGGGDIPERGKKVIFITDDD